MNLLLDTQTLLWFVLDDPRLSKKARKNIVAIDTVVFVSPASLWEIAIKISLGKYALPASFATCWYDQLLTNDFVLLPISVSHTAKVVNLPFHHRDPFDRLIIAQSLVEEISVVSSDKLFDLYPPPCVPPSPPLPKSHPLRSLRFSTNALVDRF
ncbi:MAG: type II toxin-antitoxin system VapC family toxin [Caldilineales bacterium]|nr:type II toxin-antitoxin system VapC family toxin [Caldilineales bacterium]MCW5860322.1 type II toxin-antitoxin system VapC family toxin [Caldilineales bacterium]